MQEVQTLVVTKPGWEFQLFEPSMKLGVYIVLTPVKGLHVLLSERPDLSTCYQDVLSMCRAFQLSGYAGLSCNM